LHPNFASSFFPASLAPGFASCDHRTGSTYRSKRDATLQRGKVEDTQAAGIAPHIEMKLGLPENRRSENKNKGKASFGHVCSLAHR